MEQKRVRCARGQAFKCHWSYARAVVPNSNASSKNDRILSAPRLHAPGRCGGKFHEPIHGPGNPNSGQNIKLKGIFNKAVLGGSSSWQKLGYKARSFHELHSRVVMSLRFDGNLTWGDAPFYALPYVELRGIPALRCYQGESAGEGEIDLRVRVYKRWSLVGFVGAGWTTGGFSTNGDNGPFWAGGGGFRYLLARRRGLQVGMDVARGPEDTAFYVQVGSAW